MAPGSFSLLKLRGVFGCLKIWPNDVKDPTSHAMARRAAVPCYAMLPGTAAWD